MTTVGCGNAGAGAPPVDITFYWVCPACGHRRHTYERRAPRCSRNDQHGQMRELDPVAAVLHRHLDGIARKSYSKERLTMLLDEIEKECKPDIDFDMVKSRVALMRHTAADEW